VVAFSESTGRRSLDSPEGEGRHGSQEVTP
jgi:hypothetical protein